MVNQLLEGLKTHKVKKKQKKTKNLSSVFYIIWDCDSFFMKYDQEKNRKFIIIFPYKHFFPPRIGSLLKLGY